MPSTTDISPLSITDGKISNEARIAHAKLAKATEGQILVAQPNGKFAAKTLAGDVTLTADGSTTSNVAVSADGTTVVTGATGAKGDTGSTGSQGATGATGGAGADGSDGADGTNGTNGTDGSDGTDGTDGSDATVTTSAVNTAGAVMHTDVPDSDTGFVKRTGAETYDVDTSTYSTTSHAHGDIYYTETETDTLLATKSGTSHAHGDIYYTETETDTLLTGKADSSHTHDGRYYTETESDTLLATKAATSHTHDGRYYTETEADTLLATKAASSHSHTLTDVTDSGTAAPLNVPATGDAATGEVVKGSDTRLSDARTPASHTHTLTDVTDSGGAAALAVGTTTGTVCAGDDSRLSDARTPSSTLAHKASHATGAGDALSASDIGAAASSHAHDVMASGNSYAVGFVPIGSATHSNTYLRKDGTWGTPVDTNTTYASSDFDHDALTNFVANEHLDWTADQGATNLHTGNYTNTTYSSSDFDHDALTNFVANEHLDWTTDRGSTNIHAGNYTNTTYSAGNSGLVPAEGSAGQFLKYDASWGTPPNTTANESITLSGDVSGTGTNAITCTVDDDSHNHAIGTITGVLNASAGAGSAGKLIKLDAAGHIDSTMINDADISYSSIADVPSTFAPSSHNHAATDITSGTLDTARLDVGASSGKVAAGDHTHSGYPTIDDSSALATDVWSASKIISYLVSFYATLANGFAPHKYTAAIEWETEVSTVGFTGTSGSMVCTLNHGLGTKYVFIAVRDKDDASEDVGYVAITTVVDANNVKLEYSVSDYPDVDEDKFVTIIG